MSASMYNFDNIYNDFLATTGINIGNTLDKSGYRDLGWVKDFKYMDDSGLATKGRYTFQHQKFASGYGPQTSSGMFGESTGPVFSQDLFDAAGARVASYGAQRFLADRQAGDMSKYEDWAREGSTYQAQVDSMLESASLQDEAFMKMQSDLDVARSGLSSAASKTSSIGAYSQAAKRQMQATQRTIAELGGATAPQAMQADLTFKDPVTGATRSFTDEFDEAGAYNSMATLDDARNFVNTKYTTRRDEIMSDLYGKMASDRGFNVEDFDADSDFMSTFNAADALYKHRDGIGKGYVKLGDTGFTNDSYNDAKRFIESYDEVTKFAEYRTLAELSGGTEGYFGNTYQGEGTAVSGTQALMRAQDYDINKVLEDMAFDTHARFEINDLTDIQRTRDEFNRRKSLAESTALDVERRNEINKTRERSLLEEKRKYEMTLEQQKQEYASTLSSYGASEDEAGSISFSNIRPQ
jgi:hypothetical protein